MTYVSVVINPGAALWRVSFSANRVAQLRGQWLCSAVGVIDTTQMKGRTYKEYINVII